MDVFRKREIEVQVFSNGPKGFGWIASNNRGLLGSGTRRFTTRREVLEDWLHLAEVCRAAIAAEDRSLLQFRDAPLGGIDWDLIDNDGQSLAESGVPSNNLKDASRRANDLIFAAVAVKWRSAAESQWHD